MNRVPPGDATMLITAAEPGPAQVADSDIDVICAPELRELEPELARVLRAEGLSCRGAGAEADRRASARVLLCGPGAADAAGERRVVVAAAAEEAAAVAAVRAGAFDYVLRDRLARLPLVVRRAAADIDACRRISALARTDALTGLANRTALAERAAQAAVAGRRDGSRFALLYLDLDNFKDINDTLGHAAGDRLLIAVAERLRGCVRDTDLVARLGGDEFAVLQAHVAEPADAGTLAAKLLASLAAPFALQGVERHISTSIGIALNRGGHPPADEMMMQADTALYRAKDEGRNRYCFFAPELDAAVRERVSLAEELRLALAQRQLELWYQPQVSQPDGRIVGLEALLRWRHPTRGLLLPASFLPAAEKSRLLPQINLFVLHAVCRQIVQWRRDGVPVVKMAINVSFGGFHDTDDFARQVAEVLTAHGVSPPLLDFELSEASLTDPGQDRGVDLHRIQMLGVRLVADQFGRGAMTLDRLGGAGFTQLKIATHLVANSAAEGRAWIILRSVVRLAAELGVAVVATGVETATQLRLLASAGCAVMQGRYLSPPVDAAAAAALLRAGVIAHAGGEAPAPSGGRRDAYAEALAFDDLSLLLEKLPVPVCVYAAADGAIEHLNDAFIALFGYPSGRFATIDAFWAHVLPDAERRRAVQVLCALEGGAAGSGEAELVCGNGSVRRVDIRPAVCEHLRIVAFIDVTAFRSREEQLEILSSFDDMTSFLNRRAFLERAGTEIRRAAAAREPVSLILFDLDRFKSINDRFGHVVGDRVLQVLPQAVRSWLRTSDLAGRTGGEEFMILLPGTPAEGARLVAERVRASIETLVVRSLDDEEVRFSASFGIAGLLPGETVIDNLIIRADTALYSAKRVGGNVTNLATDAAAA
jgi:diguanylate cyclase (GGDEF)-like protein